MKQFKVIKLTPLTDVATLQLNIASVQHHDLSTVLPPEAHEEVMSKIYEEVSKIPGAIIAGGPVGKEQHVFSQFKLAKDKAKVHMFPEPNPVRIYYYSANENLETAMKHKEEFLQLPVTAHSERLKAFSLFFAAISDGITALVRTVEGFINQQLSDNETYQIGGKPHTKKQMEWMDFNSKIRDVIPVICGIDFFSQNRLDYESLSLLNSLRDDLTHLKRVEASNHTSYQELSKRLMDFDAVKASNSVFTFVNTVQQGYFEEE